MIEGHVTLIKRLIKNNFYSKYVNTYTYKSKERIICIKNVLKSWREVFIYKFINKY